MTKSKKMSRDEAIYAGFCEIVPYTKHSVEVQVEEGIDEGGCFVRVHWNKTKSSKFRYE